MLSDQSHSALGGALLASAHRFGDTNFGPKGASMMTKFYSLIAAAFVFVPGALAALNQAAMIVA